MGYSWDDFGDLEHGVEVAIGFELKGEGVGIADREGSGEFNLNERVENVFSEDETGATVGFSVASVSQS